MKRISLFALPLLLAAGLSSCSTQSSDGPKPNIVVSTPAYAQLVRDLQGSMNGAADPTFDIQAITSDNSVDPHEFEPSAKDRLWVANADLVISIGTDVDAYMQPLLDSTNFPEENLIVAQDYREFRCHSGGSCTAFSPETDHNPHLWYDLKSAMNLAPVITKALEKLQPQYKAIYEKALQDFQGQAQQIVLVQENFKKALPKDRAIYFASPENIANLELVDLWLTPIEYGTKFLNGIELSVKEMNAYKALMKQNKVAFFISNEQVESPQATELEKYAKSINVPVLRFSETGLCPANVGVGMRFLDCYYLNMARVSNALKLTVQGLHGSA
jgi:zinc/manganese transport system substrate-binding protein